MLTQTIKYSAPSVASLAEYFQTKASELRAQASAENVGKTDKRVLEAQACANEEIANILANCEFTDKPATK